MRTVHYTEKGLLRLLDGKVEDDPHLAACPSCQERFRFLQRLHRAILEQQAVPEDPRLGTLVHRLVNKKVIQLEPHVSTPDLSHDGPRDNLILLAAQGETKSPPRHEVLGSFSALSEKVLLRVVADHERHCTVLHLLTEKATDAECVRIIITTRHGEQFIAETDETGVALLPGDHDIIWSEAAIALEGKRA